jgi:RND superfamily putative drug exporter
VGEPGGCGKDVLMSVLLYRLGGVLGRYGALVVVAWLLVLTAVVSLSMMLGDDYDDAFSIPGTESQRGQDIILDRFDQSGTRRSPRRSTPSPGSA